MEKEIRQYNNAQLIPYFVEMINQGHTVTCKSVGAENGQGKGDKIFNA
jgi:hypothetical protein